LTHVAKITGKVRRRRNSRRTIAAAGAGVVVLAAILAGVALAAQTSVSLTATGPLPQTITVGVGDSITFTNNDNVNHSIVTKSPSGYAAGGFVSPVIKPGQSWTVGISAPGTISYSETGFGKQHGSGKIVAGVAGTLSIAAAPKTIVYGASITITGTSPLPGTNVVVSVRAKGQHAGGGSGGWTPVATVPTASDGSYSATVTPTTSATYRAQAGATSTSSKGSGLVTSATVSVSVAPQLTLQATTKRVVHAGKLVTLVGKILPANGAHSLELLAYNASKRNWSRVATRTVSSTGTATFRFAVPYAQTALRVSVSKSDQLQAGLLKTVSKQAVVVRGTGVPPATTSGKHHKHHG
jgi:plastocyanin